MLLLANTHLFYHPAAAFARLLQTDAIVRALMCVRDRILTLGLPSLSELVIEGEEAHTSEPQSAVNLKGNGGRNEVEEMISGRSSSYPTVCTVLMGDFNSTPETAVIEYFNT